MQESDFLLLFVGCVLLCLFQILAGGIHIGFDFPELLRIRPDGFELGIGFLMLLFQSGILCIQLLAVKFAVRELGGQFAASFIELFQFGSVVRLVLLFGAGELDFLQAIVHGLHLMVAVQGVQPLVRNTVTQNSPDIQVSELFAPQDAHTGITPYRSAPLVPKGLPHIAAICFSKGEFELFAAYIWKNGTCATQKVFFVYYTVEML